MATVSGSSGNDFIHVTGDGLTAPSGYNDNPGATNGDDTIDPGSGSDTIFAGGGDDTINFASGQIDATDMIDGGTGVDTINIDNDSVTNNVLLSMTNVEFLVTTGSRLGLAISQASVPARQNLTVDMTGMDAGSDVVVIANPQTRGHYTFLGPSQAVANLQLNGGAGGNIFDMEGAMPVSLVINGGGGKQVVTLADDPANARQVRILMNTGDKILNLNGGLSAADFNDVASTGVLLSGFQHVNLGAGFDYTFTPSEGLGLRSPFTVTIDGKALGTGNTLNFDAGADITGAIVVLAGAGNDTIAGSAGDDFIRGHGGNDIIDMSAGGADHAEGGAGRDRIIFGSTLTTADGVDGGGGGDNLMIAGDYNLVFDSSFVNRTDVVTLGTGHNYTLSASDSFVAHNHAVTIDGSTLGAADVLSYDGSAETDGTMTLLGGSGADVLTGGAQGDSFVGGAGNDAINLSAGGSDTAEGDAGNDVFNVGGAFSGGDQLDGGNGNDTINFDGNYATHVVNLRAANFINVETLHFATGHSYAFKTADGNVASGHILKVDASALGAGDVLFFNGAAETDGRFTMLGGAGNDRLVGGAGNDSFTGGLGADTLTGLGGTNVFNYTGVADSTSANYDTIGAFNIAGSDFIHLPFIPGAINAAVTTGALSKATFDADLASAIGSGQLAAGDAVLYTPGSGDLATHHFLIIDANGTAGYQAGQDYVIQIGVGSDLAITTATFV